MCSIYYHMQQGQVTFRQRETGGLGDPIADIIFWTRGHSVTFLDYLLLKAPFGVLF